MAQTNFIDVRGRLGEDPSFGTAENGNNYCRFNICVNHSQDKKSWFNGITSNEETIAAMKELKKGTLCSIKGTFESGKTKVFGINAKSVSVLDKDSEQYAKFELAGNLKEDVKLETSPNGKTFCNISIANNRNFTDKNGQKQTKEPVWFNKITLWGKDADKIKDEKKGALLKFEGFYNQKKYQDKNGKEYSEYELTVKKVEKLERKQEKKNPEPEMSH